MPSKAAELRELPDDELLVRVDAAKEELFNLRFQLATGQLDNPTRIREVRLRWRASPPCCASARSSWADARRGSRGGIRGGAVSEEQTVTDTAAERGRRKVRTGVVVSDKMDKTVLVRVDRKVTHSLYRKTVRRSSKLAAHDEQNEAHLGDTVRLMETRPVSKSKRWRVVEIVERAK
jgi:small subunit ribosomal protein S17